MGRGGKIQQGRVCERVKAQERRRILEVQSQHHWVEALGFRAEGVPLSNALLQLLLLLFFNANAASIGSLLKLFRPEEQKDLDLSKPREIVVEVNPSLNCSPEQGTMHLMKKVSKTLPIIIHKLIILKNLKEILTD